MWVGVNLKDTTEINTFLETKVLNRLMDVEGEKQFKNHIAGLASAKMGKENLASHKSLKPKEVTDSDACEALAEAFLEIQERVVFPWNTKRDLRNSNASLQGADIVGIVGEGTETTFAFGETKGSYQQKSPPTVMTGQGGMREQLCSLVNEPEKRSTLIKWLYYRVFNTPFQEKFDAAIKTYYKSEQLNYVLFGALVRDTEKNPKDLSGTGEKINEIINLPTKCQLIALYLPWQLSNLVLKIINHGTEK